MQGSWEKKLIDKIHNLKSRRKRPAVCDEDNTPKAKRGRPRTSLIMTRYPPGKLVDGVYILLLVVLHVHVCLLVVRSTEDDDVATYRNREELKKELQRERPRKEIILSLARQTYPSRRASVLSEADDVCVSSLLSEFPELQKPYVVSYCTPNMAFVYLLLFPLSPSFSLNSSPLIPLLHVSPLVSHLCMYM